MTTTANWYHAHQDLVKRSEGKTSVGLVAYITGQSLKDESTGVWCVRNHPGDVLAWGTIAPAWAPEYLTNPTHLGKAWNDVERSETRKNSIVGVHWNVAGSREFSEDDHRRVAEQIAGNIMQRYGVMVTYGIHKPTDHGDDRNWHYHFGHNMRRVTADGFGEKAREIIDKKTFVQETTAIRAMIADVLNEHLTRVGSNERVTHLSYAERGVVQEPTKHLGNKQNQAELKGQSTETGDENRAIRERNARYDGEQAMNLAESRKLQHEAQIIDLLAERLKRLQSEKAMSDQPDGKRRKEADFQLASEVGSLKAAEFQQTRAEDFLRRNQEQSDRAREDEEKLKAEAKQRVDAGDITDAKARYAQASIQYDVRRPYASLCDVAAAENATYHRGQDDLAARAAEEKDPGKRDMILLRKDIEHADYMALTSERLAGISYVVTGRRDQDSQFRLDSDAAREWREKATELRQERTDLQKQMDGHALNEFSQGVRDFERDVKARPAFEKQRRENASGRTDRKEVLSGIPHEHVARPTASRDLPPGERYRHEDTPDRAEQAKTEPNKDQDGARNASRDARRQVTNRDDAARHAAQFARHQQANQRAREGGRSSGRGK